jgi:hypothetical protein
MTDDFRPGPEFRRAVDLRTRQLRHRRHLFVAAAAAAAVAVAVALPIALTSGTARKTVMVFSPPTSGPTPVSTASPPSTAAPVTTPTSALPTTTPESTPFGRTSPGTQVITYEPFNAQGAIQGGLHVTKVLEGSCTSAGVAGNMSYRCFSGSGIYDPCFARSGATSGPVVCSANPTIPDLVQLNTGSLPPPPSGAPSRGYPWAIQLADGQVCVVVDAAWGGLGPFGCQSSPRGPLVDCHFPKQATPWWTAACQEQLSTSNPFTSYKVISAWL